MKTWPGETAVGILAAYRRWISPLLTPRCRYWPTCADYAQQAIERHGLVRGGWLGLRRLGRCQPLGSGGIDLPR